MLAILRLVRLPNTLSAAGNVIAGAALAGVALEDPRLWIAAVGSMLLYAGGIAFNDWWDREKDASLHPGRPIPSGQLSAGTARAVGIVCLGLGLGSAFFAGSMEHLWISVALVAAILIYDLLPESLGGLAMVAMGSCRALNLARGLSLGVGGLTATGELALLGTFLLVLLITAVSRFEDHGGKLLALRAYLLALLLCYLFPALGIYRLHGAEAEGLLLLSVLGGLLGVSVVLPGLKAAPQPGLVVFRGVFTLVLVDCLWALSVGRTELALLLALLMPAMRWLKEAIAQPGS